MIPMIYMIQYKSIQLKRLFSHYRKDYTTFHIVIIKPDTLN